MYLNIVLYLSNIMYENYKKYIEELLSMLRYIGDVSSCPKCLLFYYIVAFSFSESIGVLLFKGISNQNDVEKCLYVVKDCSEKIIKFCRIRSGSECIDIFLQALSLDLNKKTTENSTISLVSNKSHKSKNSPEKVFPCFYLKSIFELLPDYFNFFKKNYLELDLEKQEELVAVMIWLVYLNFVIKLSRNLLDFTKGTEMKYQERKPLYKRITKEEIAFEAKHTISLLSGNKKSLTEQLYKYELTTKLSYKYEPCYEDNALEYKQYYEDRIKFVANWYNRRQEKREWKLLFIHYKEIAYFPNFFSTLSFMLQKELRFGVVVQGMDHCVAVDYKKDICFRPNPIHK